MTADLIRFFTTNWLGQAIVILAQCLAVTIPLLVAVAYMTCPISRSSRTMAECTASRAQLMAAE